MKELSIFHCFLYIICENLSGVRVDSAPLESPTRRDHYKPTLGAHPFPRKIFWGGTRPIFTIKSIIVLFCLIGKVLRVFELFWNFSHFCLYISTLFSYTEFLFSLFWPCYWTGPNELLIITIVCLRIKSQEWRGSNVFWCRHSMMFCAQHHTCRKQGGGNM